MSKASFRKAFFTQRKQNLPKDTTSQINQAHFLLDFTTVKHNSYVQSERKPLNSIESSLLNKLKQELLEQKIKMVSVQTLDQTDRFLKTVSCQLDQKKSTQLSKLDKKLQIIENSYLKKKTTFKVQKSSSAIGKINPHQINSQELCILKKNLSEKLFLKILKLIEVEKSTQCKELQIKRMNQQLCLTSEKYQYQITNLQQRIQTAEAEKQIAIWETNKKKSSFQKLKQELHQKLEEARIKWTVNLEQKYLQSHQLLKRFDLSD